MFFFFDFDTEQNEMLEILKNLIERFEYELVEFKEANNSYDKDKIGRYFSAISNEANLKGQQYGWLIFGVRNKDQKVVGTNYRDTQGLDKLKQEISNNTTGRITFIDIYEVYPTIDGEKQRVVMFKIPAAVTAIPTGWNNQYWGRNGESLVSLTLEELDRIRGQKRLDWSKQTIKNSGVEHLDTDAISLAREKYKSKNENKPHIIEEIDNMSDVEFLTKLKLLINGQLTNAAMLLLGNSDFDHLMDKHPQIMWRLYSETGADKDYELFQIPFLSAIDDVYAKIRNLKYRYTPNQLTLFPIETNQYDSSLLRELINNAIAHQDYTLGNRIYIDEFEDSRLIVRNPGNFIPNSIEKVLEPAYAPPYYRNQLLSEIMTSLNMIDTAAMGIRKIFNIQKKKFFPLPDYSLENPNEVTVTIYGKVLDENYTKLLYKHPDIDLTTAFLLDKVQKQLSISKESATRLRKQKLIEGKYPNLYVSSIVAEIVGEKAKYIKNKGLDDSHYKNLIIDYLKKFGKASKKDIEEFLLDKLPDILDEKQKKNKVRNILQSLKTANIIETDSENQRLSKWILKK